MTTNSAEKNRAFKGAGIALVALGAMLVLIGLSGGGPVIRIGGPAVGFLGAVLLAQAGRRKEDARSQ